MHILALTLCIYLQHQPEFDFVHVLALVRELERLLSVNTSKVAEIFNYTLESTYNTLYLILTIEIGGI